MTPPTSGGSRRSLTLAAAALATTAQGDAHAASARR